MADEEVTERVMAVEALEEPREILNFVTGELVPVGDVSKLAQAIEAVRVHENQVKTLRAVLGEAAIAESKRLGARTLTAGGLKLEISPDHETEWDLDVLEQLRDAGLPEERYNELVKAEVTYKVDGRVARQLAAASEEYAAVIERAKSKTPKRQYVSVKPA